MTLFPLGVPRHAAHLCSLIALTVIALGCSGDGDLLGGIPVVSRVDPGGVTGITDTNVTFEVEASNIPNQWSWNFGGAGTPNTSGAETPVVRLGAPGNYSGTVTVTNNTGTSQAFPFQIRVDALGAPPAVAVHEVDTDSLVVASTEIAVVDGRLMLAYLDNIPRHLKVARALVTNPTTTADWQVYTVDNAAEVGLHASLAEVGGLGMIAYYDMTNGDLKVARATNDNPTSAANWQVQVVAADGDVGAYTSLVEYAGRPAITYRDNTQGELRIARGRIAGPSVPADWSLLTVDSNLIVDLNLAVGGRSDLTVVGNRLMVSYLDTTNDFLLMARLTTAEPSGLGTWQIHTVREGFIRSQTALVDLRGRPAIAYFDNFEDDLILARALTAEPRSATDWRVHTVDTDEFVGEFAGMTVQDDRLAISYHERIGADLKIARALVTEPHEASDWQIVRVNPLPDEGQLTNIVAFNNRLFVSYIEEDLSRLQIAATQDEW